MWHRSFTLRRFIWEIRSPWVAIPVSFDFVQFAVSDESKHENEQSGMIESLTQRNTNVLCAVAGWDNRNVRKMHRVVDGES